MEASMRTASKDWVTDESISRFRNVVNNKKFTYFHYRNRSGKNQWNVICSCMDWITVSIRSLMHSDDLSSNIDVRAMQVFSLISSIDIVYESVMTLHSVIKSTGGRSSPFKGSTKIFKDAGGLDDDMYFKELRSQFGAHPVNLGNRDKGQWFASWPYNSFRGDCDFEIRLYSNKVGTPDRTIKLHLNELFEFLLERYMYLDDLAEELNNQLTKFIKHCQDTPIDLVAEPLEQLLILREESTKRLDLEGINSHLDDLIRLFSVSLVDERMRSKEASFKDDLKNLINEYWLTLQNGWFDSDIEFINLLSTDSLYETMSYELPKLYSWLYSNQYDPLTHYYFERLHSIDSFGYDFSISDDENITLLKLSLFDRDLRVDGKL